MYVHIYFLGARLCLRMQHVAISPISATDTAALRASKATILSANFVLANERKKNKRMRVMRRPQKL